MTDNLAQAGAYLVQTFIGLYVIVMMLRFLMQVARVDYYNPISQSIVRITDPAIRPLQRFLPVIRGVNLATLSAAFLLQLLAVMLIMMFSGYPVFHPIYLAWVAVGLLSLTFDTYFIILIVMVIASWIAPASNHPALVLAQQLAEPLCAPARRLLPPMGGIDFSIILVFAFITIINDYLIVGPLAHKYLNIPAGLILGL
jgi:YggT family protein